MATDPQGVPRHYFSLEEYFALERASDARFEYWGGDIVCVSGGTRARYLITANVHFSLFSALRGGGCRPFTGDAAVYTPTLPPYRYPDASVVCGELQYRPVNGLEALVNPALVVQVTSSETVARDEGPKFFAYQAIAALRCYLLVSQDGPRVTRYTRLGGSAWERREVTGLGASLELESVGCALRLMDIYDGVSFGA